MDNQIDAITRKVYIPKAVNNVFDTNYLLKRLRSNQKTFSGGTKIAQPLEYDELVSGGSFQGLEILEVEVNDIISNAEFDWRQYYVTMGWSRRDYLMNKGNKEQVVNMVSSFSRNASQKMQKNLTTGLFQTSKAKSTDIDGLVTAICAAGSTACGGLTSTDIATWTPQRDTTTTKLSLASLNAQERGASDGTDRVSIWVTTDDIYGYFYDIATPLERLQNKEAGDLGFTALSFNGKPFMSDKNCTSSYVFGLNENHLWLVSHSDEDMRYEPPVKPLNQAASLGQIFWMGNIMTDARRRQAVSTAIAG